MVKTDAKKGVTPRQAGMTITSTAVLTRFEIFLAALANWETAARERDIDAVQKSRWGKSQDVCILFLFWHIMRKHGGRGILRPTYVCRLDKLRPFFLW